MEEKKEKEGESLDGSAAEITPQNTVTGGDDSKPGAQPAANTPPPLTSPKKGPNMVMKVITHINVYLLLFIFIVILSGAVVFVGVQRGKKAANTTTITTQPLTQEAIGQLKDSEAKVGDPKQTLTIESNAIFSGKVLIRDSLDVAGGIKVGSALSLPGISVSGTSTFDQLQANKLSVAGDASIQGQLNLQKGLTAAGGATFGGPVSAPQLTAQTLQLTNDLQITKHIDAGGGSPSKSDGTALGSGGTASLGGTDTAGTVTINTGGSPAAGCFVNVSFAIKFSGTPHVVVTPIGSGGAGLAYYVNRTSSGFSICTATPAPTGQSFSFDYMVID
jgi:cytoskeletal protein CcmA (bactofilin family)